MPEDINTTLLTPTSPPAEGAAPNVGPNHAAALRMYPQPEEVKPMAAVPEVAALRAQKSVADQLYSPEKLYPPDTLRSLALAVNPDADGKTLQQQQVEIAYLAKDIGMGARDLDKLTALVGAATKTRPTADEMAAQGRIASKALRDKYGDGGYQQALADAKALVDRDPRFSHMVKQYGLGNHPELVLRFAELGQAQRRAGRLK